MNQKITRLLVAALCVSSACSAASKLETNRAFINVRNFRNYAEAATTFHKAVDSKSDSRIGGNLELVPFYQQTKDSSRDELGKGFGMNNLNSFKVIDGAGTTSALDSRWFIHDKAATIADSGEITLKPEHKAYGLNLCYIHELESISDGLFFRVDTGIVKVKHQMGVTFGADGVGDAAHPTLSEYLAGSKKNTTATDLTAKLTHGKIDDSETREDSGPNDVELRLGWRFVDTKNANLSVNIAGLIPTGNAPKAEFLFEPVYGSRHFQFGAGLAGSAKLWEQDDSCLKVSFDGQYRYGLEREVKRLVGLKGFTNVLENDWAHYQLVQKVSSSVDQDLIPAANVLAQELNITPGSSLDGFVMASFCMKNFCIDAGYNIFATKSNKPVAKNFLTGYYRANQLFDTSGAFAATDGTEIKKADLDLEVAGQVIHRGFGGIGVAMTEWDYPVTLGIGGSIELVQGERKQVTPANYEVFGKVGISF
jgi:hypothetical protein